MRLHPTPNGWTFDGDWPAALATLFLRDMLRGPVEVRGSLESRHDATLDLPKSQRPYLRENIAVARDPEEFALFMVQGLGLSAEDVQLLGEDIADETWREATDAT